MNIGITEAIVILAIVLVIFGAGKLPRVMGDLGRGIKNFKAGMKDEPSAGTGRLEDGATVPSATAARDETKVG